MTSQSTTPSAETPPPPPRHRWRWLKRALGPLTMALLGSVAGLMLFAAFRAAPQPLTKADVREAVATAIATAAAAPPRSTEAFKTILPSLVFIRTEGSDGQADSSGIGSGVIIRDDGTILTAKHVIDGARTISITFVDGTESKAEVVSTFPNDLAVLHANRGPELIVPAVLGGGAIQVGDETFAIGNPLGLTASFSSGVISGLDRTIPTDRGGGTLTGLIQFDAAVNPGNSGGPLLNRDGQVIGIVTALANPGRGRSFSGIGFAVPLGSAGGPGGIQR